MSGADVNEQTVIQELRRESKELNESGEAQQQ